MRGARLTTLAQRIAEQEQWIVEHGRTLAGYIARYGSANDPAHYGEGGEAIYAADRAALDALLAQQGRA
jgi:hypothetical protein